MHSRRVPVLAKPTFGAGSASQPAAASGVGAPNEELPSCAGIGDPKKPVWVCWDCLTSLGAHRPVMPLNGLTNDNWIGREKVHVREAKLDFPKDVF